MPEQDHREQSSSEPVDGFLLVDKPADWTSHDVVGRMRRIAKTRRVGHAGTLDPMATGLLVLGINRGTKLMQWAVGTNKTYEATIRLGQSTITDDAQGEFTASQGALGLDRTTIDAALTQFRGPIQQVPSAVSAIKVKGERAYKRVRDGETVELEPRPVTIHRFDVLDVRPGTAHTNDDAVPGTTATGSAVETLSASDDDAVVVDTPVGDNDAVVPVTDVDVVVECSSGTYIRALARDLGGALGTGGHLTALRRTRIGPWSVDDAAELDTLETRPEHEPVPIIAAVDAATALLPERVLDPSEVVDLSHGRRIEGRGAGTVAAVAVPASGDGAGPGGRTLVAILDDGPKHARPVLVLAAAQPTPSQPARAKETPRGTA